ncbi:MAG: alpha-hydroxy acid oxidase [Bryobacteraceae bacterium]|nr:alpha-hydroxy acid oxidase [Bryobacteraceae bacterium]
MTRRDAFQSLAAFVSASPLLAQQSGPKLEEMVNLFDFEPIFRSHVNKATWDYVTGGGWDEWTVKRNREAFERIILRPRYFVKVDSLDVSTEVLGQKLAMPILVAPTGTHSLVHAEGEVATARGAGAAGAVMCVSTSSSFPLEKIAEAARAPLFFQLYTGPTLEATRQKVERAVSLGCKAILVTADGPYQAPRERDKRNRLEDSPVRRTARSQRGHTSESGPYGLPLRFQGSLDWSFVDQLCGYAKVPVLVKGILTAEDAKLAMLHGAAGVVVSNHGGRYLDSAPSTIEVLPEIVDAIGRNGTVLIDGGIRRGTDVLKALAIGAKAVLIGRPPLWGLGAFGAEGVDRVIRLLRDELAWAMGLAGRPTIASIDRSLIRIQNQY